MSEARTAWELEQNAEPDQVEHVAEPELVTAEPVPGQVYDHTPEAEGGAADAPVVVAEQPDAQPAVMPGPTAEAGSGQ